MLELFESYGSMYFAFGISTCNQDVPLITCGEVSRVVEACVIRVVDNK